MSFSDYNLDPLVLKYLKRQGIEEPTEIQAQAIPVALEGHDILAISQTGSGKTLAFGLPALTCLDEEERGNNRMLILAPTRELAVQVHKVIETIGRILELRSVCIYGGVSINSQTQQLRRGVDIIVATPGRLMDHMERGNIDFSALTTLVLDEADRMLDMGFLPDIKEILSALPDRRQTMLFSATFAKDVELITRQFMHNPKRIEIGRVAPAKAVNQNKYTVEQAKKPLLLQKILSEPEVTSSIVFMRTKHRTDRVAKTLQQQGFKVQAIHGGRTQGQRKQALDGFRKGRYNVLVATDVAARGIDIQGITHVINYDIPGAYDDYVHRIGRTARASATGDAITFVAREDAKELRIIEKELGNPIPEVDWVGSITVDTAKGKSKTSGASRRSKGKQNGGQRGNGNGRGRAENREGKPGEGRRSKSSRTERFKRSANRKNNDESRSTRSSEGRPGRSDESRPERSSEGRPRRSEQSRSERSSEGRGEGRPNRSGEDRPNRSNDSRPRKNSAGNGSGKPKRSNKRSNKPGRPSANAGNTGARPSKGKASRRGPVRESRRTASA